MKNMNTCLKGLVAGFLLTAGVMQGVAQAADVAVIVNSSNPNSLTIETIKNIYSDRLTTWRSNGQRIEVYNLPENQDARDVFARNVLGMSGPASATAESQRKVNNTLKNPTKIKRERLVVSLIARKRNAIGYVPLYLVEGKESIRIVKVLKENE